MSYTITDTDTGERQNVADRAEAVRVMRDLGLNQYAAIRLLDVADGLAPLDMPRPVTVERSHADARGWDTRPGSLRNEAPDGDAAYTGPRGAQPAPFQALHVYGPERRRVVDFYLDGSPVYAD